MKKLTVLAFVALSGLAFSQNRPKKDSIKQKEIDEVVLIGYGEVKKSDLTGSVSSLKPSDAAKNAAQGIETLLQGRTSGVVVNNTGFEPTAPINVKIRGVNSLTNGTQPLYVIDGIIVNSGDEREPDPLSGGNSYLAPQNGLMGLNPKDIESMEVLKDASATAIYGSRASNGVVIITTKKGKTGKAKFTYSGSTKVGDIVRAYDMLNGREYAEYRNRSSVNPVFNFDGNNIYEVSTGNLMQEVNWSDYIYRTAISQNHRLTASGGSEKNKYYFALGFADSQGITPNAFTTQMDFSTNLSNQLTDNLKLDTKIAVTYNNSSASKGTESLGSSSNNLVRQIISSAPFFGYSSNQNGNVDYNESNDGPIAWVKDYDDLVGELRTLGSLQAEYKINDVFKYRFVTGVDYRSKERKIWYGTSIQRGRDAKGEAGISTLDRFRYNIDNTLLFNKSFNENHKINGTVGFILDEDLPKVTTYQASNFDILSLRAEGIRYANFITPLVYFKTPTSIMSFIGRANYNLYNKYSLTATFRADGTSKFAKDRRWGYFPAFAFAWQLHKEKMFENYSKLSNLKFRTGWGVTGNQNSVPFQYFVSYANTATPYPNPDGTSSVGLVPDNIANLLLKWETTYQTNLGLDFGFFNNRFTASFDLFNKNTKDLLIRLPLPGSSDGVDTILTNIGALNNKGIEINASADILKSKDLKWNVYGSFSIYRNKITKYGGSAVDRGSGSYAGYTGDLISGGNFFRAFANVFFEGYPAGMFWGYKTDGIIDTPEKLAAASKIGTVPAQMGDLFVVDVYKDGVIDDKDKTFIGDPNPDFTYGFGTSIDYKNFYMSMFFNGVFGNDIANGNLIRDGIAFGSSDNIRKEAYYGAWSSENPNGNYPRIGYKLNQTLAFYDRMVEDGSFLRLQNLTIGYRIPMKKSFIDTLDLSITGTNLLLFTNYSGYDPEVDSYAFDNNRVGLDWNSFPNQRTYSLGVNITF